MSFKMCLTNCNSFKEPESGICSYNGRYPELKLLKRAIVVSQYAAYSNTSWASRFASIASRVSQGSRNSFSENNGS